MTDTPQPHRATPEQWTQIERFVDICSYDSCLLELRARIEALEAAQQQQSASAAPVPASAGSLVEAVRRVIGDDAPCSVSNARAAIRAVAGWLEQFEFVGAVHALRGEVGRG